MLSEKDIKLTINKLWNEMKNIKLEQNNAVYSVGMRTAQIMALMKIINREELFTKQEIENVIGNLQIGKINVPIQQETQLKLEDMPIEELQEYVKNFKKQPKRKPSNPNIQVLEPKERV